MHAKSDGVFAWWFSFQGDFEYCHNGGNTREETLALALTEYDHAQQQGATGLWILQADKALPQAAWGVDAEKVIEDIETHANEETFLGGEDGDFSLDASPEQVNDLQAMLEEAVKAWHAKHKMTSHVWLFGETRNEEHVAHDDALAQRAAKGL